MRKNTKIVLFVVSAVLVWAFARSIVQRPEQGQTVDQYQERLIASVNRDLESRNNPVRQKIENAHLTVTAKSARVSSCRVTTVDGSNHAGKRDRNISEVDLVITVIWDGWIEKNGYTEFEIVYDIQNDRLKDAKYLRSSAMINMDTINWFDVGFQIGGYIAAASM